MQHQTSAPEHRYTCQEYREEMILAALQRTLQQPGLSAEKREMLVKEIDRLEMAMGLK